MLVSLHEIEDGEIVLALKQAGAAPDNLLELDHRLDRPKQDDVANVARVDPGGQLVAGSQNRRDRLVIVLELAEPLLADSPSLAVTRTQ